MTRVGQIFREKLVSDIKEGLDKKSTAFLLSYAQLSGAKSSEIRKKLSDAGADVYVSKNCLARIALKDLQQEDLAQKVSGQTAFVWSDKDSVEIAKILVEFSKENENVTIPGGLVEGKTINQDDVKRLSELPSRDVLLSQLLATIQAPVTRLMGALNAKSRELLSILKQLSEKKGGN
ncbi:MAG: 50S ribosomal protein L10 [Candidatus Omnitrophica bacterium]|nr:50S ribosomal protein L10 [Candidatus Omnitrophota bacterium]